MYASLYVLINALYFALWASIAFFKKKAKKAKKPKFFLENELIAVWTCLGVLSVIYSGSMMTAMSRINSDLSMFSFIFIVIAVAIIAATIKQLVKWFN